MTVRRKKFVKKFILASNFFLLCEETQGKISLWKSYVFSILLEYNNTFTKIEKHNFSKMRIFLIFP